MSEPENFLSRWSRRKLEDERQPDARAPEPSPPGEGGEPQPPDGIERSAGPAAQEARAQAGLKKTEKHAEQDEQNDQTLDLSTLPSLESITAATDVRVF